MRKKNVKVLEENATGLHLHKTHCRVTVKHETTSGRFQETIIYRHHIEPRVKLHVPREVSFPIPLRYIAVTRAASTTFNVMIERRIDDYWNIERNRDLSDAWTCFARFTTLDEKTSRGYTWSGERLTNKANNTQARSPVARNMEKYVRRSSTKSQAEVRYRKNRSSTMQES